MPGEQINGSLEIQPKPENTEKILNDALALIKIIQLQKYTYLEDDGDDDSRLVVVSDEDDIFSKYFDFMNYEGASILSGIHIPFSIQIPLKIHTSINFGSDYYVKHFLSVDFPGIKAKRTLMIIIKRFEMFSNENKLLKIPASAFGDFYKKKRFNSPGGKVTCLLKLPKNKFYYFEKIPFEIYLDSTELNMKVKTIKLRINMKIYFNSKYSETHFITEKNLELFSRKYPVDNSLNKFEIKDSIQLKNDSNFSKYISVIDKYHLLDEKKKLEVDYNFKNMILMPFCFGGLINPEFILQVDIIYKQLRSSSSFSMLIDFDDCRDFCLIIDESDNINNILNNHENENKKNNSFIKDFNSISEDNSKKNMAESEGFVVYEEDDFEKALFGDKNK